MISARHGTLPLIPLLLNSDPPASPTAHDGVGSTALHHASAAGELKALRMLLQAGASPLAENKYFWTPIDFSSTVAAEVYFKNLVAEFEKRRVEGIKEARERERERERQRLAGVRLVTSDDAGGGIMRSALEAGRAHSVVDWSPVEAKRAVTPTGGRSEAWSPAHGAARARARSGD